MSSGGRDAAGTWPSPAPRSKDNRGPPKAQSFNENEKRGAEKIVLGNKLQCLTCHGYKSQSAYSAKQLELHQLYIYKRKHNYNVRHETPICYQCSPVQRTELKCFQCDQTKGTDAFSKNAKKNGDKARCLDCVQDTESRQTSLRDEFNPETPAIADDDYDGEESSTQFGGGSHVPTFSQLSHTLLQTHLSTGNGSTNRNHDESEVWIQQTSRQPAVLQNATNSVRGQSQLGGGTVSQTGTTWADLHSAQPPRARGGNTEAGSKGFARIPAVKVQTPAAPEPAISQAALDSDESDEEDEDFL